MTPRSIINYNTVNLQHHLWLFQHIGIWVLVCGNTLGTRTIWDLDYGDALGRGIRDILGCGIWEWFGTKMRDALGLEIRRCFKTWMLGCCGILMRESFGNWEIGITVFETWDTGYGSWDIGLWDFGYWALRLGIWRHDLNAEIWDALGIGTQERFRTWMQGCCGNWMQGRFGTWDTGLWDLGYWPLGLGILAFGTNLYISIL